MTQGGSGSLIICDSFIMLGRDENNVYMKGNHGTILIVIFNSDLSLTIRLQPRASSILLNLSEAGAKLGSKSMAQGHKFRGPISFCDFSIASNACSDLFRPSKLALHCSMNNR